jgi:hypothetical protein
MPDSIMLGAKDTEQLLDSQMSGAFWRKQVPPVLRNHCPAKYFHVPPEHEGEPGPQLSS